jgi:hypothetical protein
MIIATSVALKLLVIIMQIQALLLMYTDILEVGIAIAGQLKAKMCNQIFESAIDTIACCWTSIRQTYLNILDSIYIEECKSEHIVTVPGRETEYKVYFVGEVDTRAANMFWSSSSEHTPDNLRHILQKESPDKESVHLQGVMTSSCIEEPPRAFRLKIDLNSNCATLYAVPNEGNFGETKECAYHIISIQLNSLSIRDVMKPLLCSAKNKDRIRRQRATLTPK